MGSMGVASCRCCMFVSFVHDVAVLNAANTEPNIISTVRFHT